MIALLGWLVDGVAELGAVILAAGEGIIDAGLAAIVAAYTAAVALLPSMGDSPAIGTPSWLGWLNWFYPVGDLVAGLGAIVSIWVAFLAVRYVLRLVRAI